MQGKLQQAIEAGNKVEQEFWDKRQLVKKINLDRTSSRYCPNLSPHAHFKCTESGAITDLPICEETLSSLKSILPKGFSLAGFDLSFHGKTPSNN